VSLSEEFVEGLLDRIEACESRLDELEERRREIKEAHDQLRELLYEEWDPAGFDAADPQTYPSCLQDQGRVLGLLDELNRGVGYAIKLVIKHRYPGRHPEQPPPTQPPPQPQSPQPIVLQTQPQQQSEATRVRSWWTGWWEVRLEKMRLEYLRELAERETPRAVTGRVVRDPIEVGNELLAALHETKKFLSDCYLCWPIHRNQAFALNLHEAFRDRVSRLLSTVEAFCYAALELEADEINRQLLQQIGYFTRVLEAQAQAPVTIQEIHGYRPGGISPEDVFKRRRRG
jgi:hypothetical protein